jgi:fructokinase
MLIMNLEENTNNKESNNSSSPPTGGGRGKILCIGEALIDMICTDKGQSLANGNNFLKKAGGAPTNVAAAIAALGGSVELAAKVGVDPFGNHLIKVMQDFGVGTKWMLQHATSFTTFAFVSLMENGERDFYFNRGADGQLSKEDIDAINLDEFSIIHFGSATGFLPGPLQEAYKILLEKATAKNIFISFDPNYRHLLFQNGQSTFIEQSWNFLDNCHFFKVSDEEAMMLTGTQTVKDAAAIFLEKTYASFAITLGKDGTLLGLNGITTIVPSIAITPVDTTGAGDAFVGAVLYQLSSKTPGQIRELSVEQWRQIVVNANKAGARTCEYMGAMEAFKHLNNSIFN